MKTLTVFAPFDRSGTPSDWQIYNAPRPLPGDRGWQGEFHHGVHYSSLDPQYSGSERAILKVIEALDGWRVIVTNKLDFENWIRAWQKERNITVFPPEMLGELRSRFLRERFGVEE